MKRSLILYHHGLGDLILLTPFLRHLYNQGYKTDLMCRGSAILSHLFHSCPYIGTLIEIQNPWRSKEGRLQRKTSTAYKEQEKENLERFNRLKRDYDWSGKALHDTEKHRGHKIEMTGQELGLEIEDKSLEIFISEKNRQVADYFLQWKGLREFIFYHPESKFHPIHNWNSWDWIKSNLPELPVVNISNMEFKDINIAFEIARRATHRVLVSSVFVHACDAMDAPIDAVNYGIPNRKAWPKNMGIIKHIRERGKWIK